MSSQLRMSLDVSKLKMNGARASVDEISAAPIRAVKGSGWRGSRPRNADGTEGRGTEGSLDARQRFRKIVQGSGIADPWLRMEASRLVQFVVLGCSHLG